MTEQFEFTTQDTGEAVRAPQLPADDRTGDGYDWMDTLTNTPWSVLPNWGSEGWDAGAWPYIIFAAAKHYDGYRSTLYGYGLYIEGDTHTHWFRTVAARQEAITAAVFDFWKLAQSDGPADLPNTAAELPARYRRPYAPGQETVE